MFGFFEAEDDPEVVRRPDRRRGGLAARARARADARADGLHAQRRVRDPDRGLRRAVDDPRAVAPALLRAPARGSTGSSKEIDLLMWELWFGELKEGTEMHPLIHAAAQKSRDEGVVLRSMRKRDMAAEVGRFMEVYNEAWGAQLGLRPDHRGRGRLPGQEPEAGARRELGDDRRERRRGGRRGAHAARRRAGAGEDERPGAALRLVALPAPPQVHRPAAGLRARRQVASTSTSGSPRRSTSATCRPPPGPGRAAATWAGSWRPTSR